MKKGISKNKVQRMRNLVTGDYSAKTKISSGYTKKLVDRTEGEVWEEGGKQWTIKRGIKRSVVKTEKLKSLNRVPLSCPACSRGMSHPAHKQMFKLWGMCVDCVMFWEQEMKRQGTFKDFMTDFNRKNFDAYIKDAFSEYNDWLDGRNSNTYVTEAGDIEEWKGGKSNEELRDEFKKAVEEAVGKYNRREQNEE